MRDKLIELLDETFEKQYDRNLVIAARPTADFLISHGVTFAEDNNVPTKWIPVSERLPTAEFEKLHKETGRKVYHCFVYRNSFHFRKVRFMTVAYFDGMRFIDPESGSPIGSLVTHWMPMPEPPKEGEA